MSYHARIDKLVESVLGEMQPGLMAKVGTCDGVLPISPFLILSR